MIIEKQTVQYKVLKWELLYLKKIVFKIRSIGGGTLRSLNSVAAGDGYTYIYIIYKYQILRLC